MKYRMFFSKQGSAYLSVLLVILLSSILGVSLLTFTLVNLKTSANVYKSNDVFYKTEASITTVQIEIEKQVRYAQELAKDAATANRSSIIALASSLDTETGISYFNEELFKSEYEKFFCDSFNKYMCQDGVENGKKIILNLKKTVDGILDITMPQYDMSLIDNPKQDLYIYINANKFEGGNIKYITTRFKILREPAISIKKVVSKRRNPIWMRAITTEGDVIAVGGKVTINASGSTDPKFKKSDAIYAWGTNNFRVDGTNLLGNNYGGIIAGVNQNVINSLGLSKFGLTSQNGIIKIVGETVTDSYIHTFGDSSSINIDVASDATETVTNLGIDLSVPQVFAESIQTEEFSNNNNITILGDAFVKDDLELNGGNSSISISGSFLGFSSGPDSDFSTDKYANRSSSIAYNDAFESSHIDVGKYVVVSGVAYNSNVTYETDPYKGTPYKTGESLGIGENHKLYRYYFDGEDINQNFDNGFKLNMDGQLYDYPLYSGKTGAPPNGVGNDRTQRFKDYLIKYYDANNSYLDYAPNLGGNDLINIGYNNSNKIEGYSLGVLPANGKLYFPLILSQTDKSSSAYTRGLLKDFDTIYGSDQLNTLKNAWKERYNEETWLANKKTDRKTNSEFYSLVDYGVNFDADTANLDNSIILKAKNGNLTLDMSALKDKGGLIFATGDIVITGSVDGEFKGSIVAGGSIVFKGSGMKTITYNEKNVLDAIKLNSNVKAALSKGGISEVDPDSVEIELKSQKNVLIEDYREIK